MLGGVGWGIDVSCQRAADISKKLYSVLIDEVFEDGEDSNKYSLSVESVKEKLEERILRERGLACVGLLIAAIDCES